MDTRKMSRAKRLAEKIWSYVRVHHKSLSSEIHCKVVSDAIIKEIVSLEEEIEALQATIEMLLDDPPPVDARASWDKRYRINGEVAKWIYKYCVGRKVPRKYVKAKLKSDFHTIVKICEGKTWVEDTASLRKKYGK